MTACQLWRPTVIAATSTPAALAAKAATMTIPIIFELVSRPGGNVTGVIQWNIEVAPKRLELLHELLPTARVMALLVDPTDPANAKFELVINVKTAKVLGLVIPPTLLATTDEVIE